MDYTAANDSARMRRLNAVAPNNQGIRRAEKEASVHSVQPLESSKTTANLPRFYGRFAGREAKGRLTSSRRHIRKSKRRVERVRLRGTVTLLPCALELADTYTIPRAQSTRKAIEKAERVYSKQRADHAFSREDYVTDLQMMSMNQSTWIRAYNINDHMKGKSHESCPDR
ncbi:hypothetical protein BJ508DRAFT_310621 [Ascobolus immersus RN42]|uniref:Uncharacterized protein n=1 Tax=Ascobolus immersus RN42 TaxID=1160509 RepID=A0A3N4HT19_ASCIM|nr:hypothetical protein BJ508DRAFT_310621 [Ascobolus immersus RN42]